MSKSEFTVALPDEMIKGIVMSEMVKSLGNKDQLIEAVVKQAFTAKAPNRYDNKTVFQVEIEKAINDAALDAFKQWLDENKERVRAALLRELDRRKKYFADQLANALLDGRFHVKPTITVEIGNKADY